MTTFITRCPACQQAFKISEMQLAAKNGTVRCGFCQNVFNANESLYRARNVLQDDVARVEREAELERRGAAQMAELAGQLKGFDAVDDEIDNSNLLAVEGQEPTTPIHQEVINGAVVPEVQTENHRQEEAPKKKNTLLWSLVTLAAIGAIGAQVAAMNRNTVVEKVPQAEPVMAKLCTVLHCEATTNGAAATQATATDTVAIVAPIDIAAQELSRIEGSEYAIKVTLRNNMTAEAPYPTLSIVLKAEKGDILTRRFLKPADYLTDVTAKLPANQTAEVAFVFEMTEGIPTELLVAVEP